MTLKEAKKIVEEEGFSLEGPGKPGVVSEAFTEYESPEVCEAMQVVCSAGYMIMMFEGAFNARKNRLKEEYEKNTKAPGSAENRIKEDSGVNPALAESASQFNDALLDEQAKKIKRLGKEIARLNGIIHEKNDELKCKTKGCCELVAENLDLKESLRKTKYFLEKIKEANSKNLDTCFKNEDTIDELKKRLAEKTRLAKKYAKELSDSSLHLCKLEKQLKDKDAVLADVAEKLRLSKIREKNLAELGLKYVGENEKLKKELADKVVAKIDAQALKSAERALAEKDEVIADLGKELAAQKGLVDDISLKYDGAKHNLKLRMDECEKLKKELEGTNNLVRMVRNASKEYCEYGVAAEKMIQKLSKIIVSKGLVPSDVFEKCRLWANGYRFNPQLPELSEEEEKKLEHAKKIRVSSDNAEEGADLYGVIVLCGKDVIDALKKAKDADIWQE